MSAPRAGRRAPVDTGGDLVTLREMIEYVDRREGPLMLAIEKLSTQIDQHNDYHRAILEKAIDSATARVWQIRGVAIAAIGGVGGLVVGIIALVQHGGG
jgi:hypothetical protein